MAELLKSVFKKQIGLGALALIAVVLALVSIQSQDADASKSLVTVYADGSERVISTQVLTVGEALERAGIELSEDDLVEPSKDTFINEAVFRINVYRAKPITVVDGDKQKTVMTPHTSPRLIAEDAGFKVYSEDKYEFELIDNILDVGAIGEKLLIDRATPVKISLYGDVIEFRTHLSTVGEVLDEAGIKVQADDVLSVKRNAKISSGMDIFVSRIGTDIVVMEEPIAFESESVFDSNMFAGQEEVKSAGVNGVNVVTYEIELKDGVEVSRKLLQKVVKTEPVTEVKVVGTKVVDPNSNVAIGQSMAASQGWVGAEWQCLYSLWMKESGWTHTSANPSSGAYGIPQALPGSKMASAGADWQSNPATQISWGMSYIIGRYSTPCGAWNHAASVGWY